MEENNQNSFPTKETGTSVLSPAPNQSITPNQSISAPKPELKNETVRSDFSVKKWGLLGIVIAFLNPVFAGLVLGLVFLTEPKFKKIGVAVVIISIIWGAVSYFVADKYWTVIFRGF